MYEKHCDILLRGKEEVQDVIYRISKVFHMQKGKEMAG